MFLAKHFAKSRRRRLAAWRVFLFLQMYGFRFRFRLHVYKSLWPQLTLRVDIFNAVYHV